ncbi:hypothetical protein J6590_057804 [Homalodisca vitripennis]|nr:hypothetical protein J6590_057804 [Homalodisca vitripennis]
MEVVMRGCDAPIPKKRGPRHVRAPVYWRKEDITLLRRRCFGLRRSIIRGRRGEMVPEAVTQEFPTELGYRVVMRRLPVQSAGPIMYNKVDALFPTHPVKEYEDVLVDSEQIPFFAGAELSRAERTDAVPEGV